MKKFTVDVDITMSCRVYDVEAENEEEVRNKVANWIGDDPWHYVKDGHYVTHEFEDVREKEEEPCAPLTFNILCEKLRYFSVANNQSKTIEEIAEECRAFIRKSGHQCLDDDWDDADAAREWAEKNHPEIADNMEETSVLYEPLTFLCVNMFDGELHFADLNITFFGDYANGVGVFSVKKE